MQVRPGGTACGTEAADNMAELHRLANADVDRGQVSVTGSKPVAVVDLDHLAVAPEPARARYRAVRGDAHRVARVAAEIQSRVHRGCTDEGIDPHPKCGREVDLAHHRLA